MFQAQNTETINSRPTWKLSASFKIIMTTSVTSTVFHNIAPELQDQDQVFGLRPVLSYDRKSQSASLIETDTYCWWMTSSRLLLTVRPHHWWRADEHLCVLHDSSDQLSSSLGGDSLLCSSRLWTWKDKWNLQDNLHISYLPLYYCPKTTRVERLGTKQFSVCTYFQYFFQDQDQDQDLNFKTKTKTKTLKFFQDQDQDQA